MRPVSPVILPERRDELGVVCPAGQTSAEPPSRLVTAAVLAMVSYGLGVWLLVAPAIGPGVEEDEQPATKATANKPNNARDAINTVLLIIYFPILFSPRILRMHCPHAGFQHQP